MVDEAHVLRLNDQILELTALIRRNEADGMLPHIIERRRDRLNRLYAELSDAWDVSYAALGARP